MSSFSHAILLCGFFIGLGLSYHFDSPMPLLVGVGVAFFIAGTANYLDGE